jgi:hypothetical protein
MATGSVGLGMNDEPDLPDLTDANVRAGIIAHAIRLGKCPPPGITIGFNVQVQTGERAEIERGDFSTVKDLTEKIPLSFEVSAEDIENAKRLINGQRISYREPKLSIMPLKQK